MDRICPASVLERPPRRSIHAAIAAGVLEAGAEVLSVESVEAGCRVQVNGEEWQADSVVVATGGLSIPKIGATVLGYKIARQFGLALTELAPALVSLEMDPDFLSRFGKISGVSADVALSVNGKRFRENILFTHRGLSGPAILQISSYWREGGAITLDFLPGVDAHAFLLERKRSRPRSFAQTALAEIMPGRLAQALTAANLPARELANISDGMLATFAHDMKNWPYRPGGTEGYTKAEVTAGGIDTRDLSSKTMEARGVAGLYAIGEAVDVTGWLGGYNFQWAWSSGWAAGQAI